MRKTFLVCLLCALMLPLSGCFTAMTHFMGGSPSVGEAIAAGALDVVTFPVQMVMFGSLALCEYIDNNTGEKGRRNKELKDFNREVMNYEQMLDSDFTLAYTEEAFLSDELGDTAHVALRRWLSMGGIRHPEQPQIDAFAEKIMESPRQADYYRVVLNQKNLSPEVKKKLCIVLIEYARTQLEDEQRSIAYYIARHLTDDEIKASISTANDFVDQAFQKHLDRKAKQEEEKRQSEERRKAQEEEAKRQLKALHEARILREKQLIELAKGIAGEEEEFQKAFAVRHEGVVASMWIRSFANKKAEFPPENIKRLAYAYTQIDEPVSHCCHTLFSRPELSADDVRALYGRMLFKLRKIEARDISTCYLVSSLVKNKNCPSDVIEASYKEPLLADLRRIYVIHHFDPDVDMKEKENFDKKAKKLFDEFNYKEDISYEQYSEKLFKLTKPLLPKECPEDWVKYI